VIQFQFLIGRLDTIEQNKLSLEREEFQFLIGRLDTAEAVASLWEEGKLFQFLIGRLDTRQAANFF